MIAGLLDQRIEIQQQALTQDAFGQQVPVWTTFNTLWADVISMKGTEAFKADRKTENIDFKVRTRYVSGVTEDMRVVYKTKNYDIVSIEEIERQEGLIIFISLHKDML